MRAFLWAWIIGFTALILFMPPMLEKQPTVRGEAVHWISKGAFGQSVLGSSVSETRVDVSRFIISLLAINFLPAVALWRYNEIREWLQRHKSELDTFARLGVFLACMIVVVVLIGIVLQAQRSGAKVVSSSPAIGPAQTLPAATPNIPPGWELVDPTPTPVRRAIPVTQ